MSTKHRWNYSDGEKVLGESCPFATASNTNPVCVDLGMNQKKPGDCSYYTMTSDGLSSLVL